MNNWPSEATTTIAILAVLLLATLLGVIWLLVNANKVAAAKFNQWKEQDIAAIRDSEARTANLSAVAEMEIWKQDYSMAIRQDAINRSQAVIKGKITEHLVPYFPLFPFNPKDARFIGSPIDILIFDGMDDDELKEIVFLEIKVGESRITLRQRQIRDAITEGRVVWRELRL